MTHDPHIPPETAIRAVIFDWAGTTVDFGSRAPITALLQVFGEFGVPVSTGEARGPMGTNKRDHIRALLALPRIRDRWVDVHGHEPDEQSVNDVYRSFLPIQTAAIAASATPVPGVVDAVARLRERGIAIGSDTGYNRDLMDILEPAASGFGYAPDVTVTSDDTDAGRPSPDMALEVARRLGVDNPARCVKVDDTPAGILEGLRAGMWTVGVSVTGNANGLSLEEWGRLDEVTRVAVRCRAEAELEAAGAHIVIDSAADISGAVDRFESLLAAGMVP